MARPNDYIKTLTSFSGADLVVNFGSKVIGELQSISWAVQREKAPIYTFGSPDARSFSRGKRGIAGQLAFAVFDRDAMLENIKDIWNDIAPTAMFTAAGNRAKQGSEDFSNLVSMTGWSNVAAKMENGANVNKNQFFSGKSAVAADQELASNGTGKVLVPPGFRVIRKDNLLYADMVPPFDVTMTFANEYGQAAFQKIYDVEILNDGSGVSVDSIVMERHMTFIARRISPITHGVYTRDSNGNVTGKNVY